MIFDEYIKQNRKKKPNQDIAQRWQTRVVSQNLFKEGEAGAEQYLDLYGRGIAAPKCIMFAVYAEQQGYPEMALGFWKKAFELETGTKVGVTSASAAIAIVRSLLLPDVEKKNLSEYFPNNLQPGTVVTMQPEDAKRNRMDYVNDPEYWGQPKRDGHKVLVFAAPDGVWYQSRSMKLRPSPSQKLDKAFHVLAMSLGYGYILEGELYYLDCAGGEHRTGAQAAQINIENGHGDTKVQICYMPFYGIYQHADYRNDTHIERIAVGTYLTQVLRGVTDAIVVPVTAHTKLEKEDLVSDQMACQREGEVWTRITAKYHPGKDKSEDMVRTKYLTKASARITELTKTTVAGRLFGAIRIEDPVTHQDLGSVGTGFDAKDQAHISAMFAKDPLNTIIPIVCRGFTENGKAIEARLDEDFLKGE